jgi:predicted transcriptional regulator
MDFYEALKLTIEAFNLKASDLAKTSEINPEEISRFKTGKKDFTSRKLNRLIKGLPNNAQAYFYSLMIRNCQNTVQIE